MEKKIRIEIFVITILHGLFAYFGKTYSTVNIFVKRVLGQIHLPS